MGPFEERSPRIFLSAGEASGDLHGSFLVRALKELRPDVRVACLGGPMLREAGAQVLADNGEIAVVGLTEVLHHARDLFDVWKRIRNHIIRRRPDLIVLIDFPDFNFLLGRLAKRFGIKVFYYISPQVWAWRSGRVRTLKRIVDEMAVILPFEVPFYRRHAMTVHFVGHPLLDVVQRAPSRAQALRRHGTADGTALIGLLPGSRKSEVRLVFPVLLEAACRLRERMPGASFIIPVAPTLDPEPIRAAVAQAGLAARVVAGDTYGVIRACDLIVTVSGTVTLEAALLDTPMIVVNRVSNMSYYLGRDLIRVRYIALPNLIADRAVVPELLQQEARADLVCDSVLEHLRDPEKTAAQKREFARIRERLGDPGVAHRVARMVLGTIAP